MSNSRKSAINSGPKEGDATEPNESGDVGRPSVFRIMATTDLHMHLLPWDYYSDTASHMRGLSQIATLIGQARDEVGTSILLDNGDFLQGSPVGDLLAEAGNAPAGSVHPMIAAMNHLAYDAVCIGNHEFSHGLEFLHSSLAAARFPILSANALTSLGSNPGEDTYLFAPSVMVSRMVPQTEGPARELKIGIVGLTPFQVAQWEQEVLRKKVFMRTMFEAAEFQLSQLRAQGADIVVALAHSGLGDPSTLPDQENTVIRLAKDLDFDAIIAGHTHNMFPSGDFSASEAFDPDLGLIDGTPVVMPGFFGSHLGVIDLQLSARPDGGWTILHSKAALRAVFERKPSGMVASSVSEDPAIAAIAQPSHDQTRRWARRKIGETHQALHSFFAVVSPSPSVRLVTSAQREFVRRALRGTIWDGLPILSAAAPIRTGGRSGPENYTHIPAGPISLRNIADLYAFPNTVIALNLTGSEIRNWLERAAAQFHTIAPGAQDAELIDLEMPGFDFDLIDGISYQIDLSKPARFDCAGRLLSPKAGRITNLTFDGASMDMSARFVLASNSYRMGGGGGYGVAKLSKQILRSSQSIRDLVASYVASCEKLECTDIPNWRFAAMPGTSVTFESSPHAAQFAGQVPGLVIEPLERLPSGFQRFRLRL